MMLVSGATKTVRRLQGHPNLGVLLVPNNGNAPIADLPWAIDNGAFSGLDEAAFRKLLAKHVHVADRALWVTCPDVVSDHDATLSKFRQWAPEIAALGYPLAFAAQNGLTMANIESVPWGEIACIFIGGDDEYKLGSRWLIAEAKRRGKLVHVGRVNSLKRLRWAHDAGADSVDGTSVSMFADRWLPPFLRFIGSLEKQSSFQF